MATDDRLVNAHLKGAAVRYLIIVARGEFELYRYLAHHYGRFEGVQVVSDRRLNERRKRVQPYAQERRRKDRRGLSTNARGFRGQPFVILSQ